jgi:VWFA-related protein
MLRLGALIASFIVVSSVAGQGVGDTVFRVETSLLQIEVRTWNHGPEPAERLTKEDFVLTENGLRREIATLEYVPQPEAKIKPGPVASEPVDAEPIPRAQTLIYVVTQAAETEAVRVHGAVRDFLNEQLQPGMTVSLGGLPFTNDREKLLRTLDRMLKYPRGKARGTDGGWLPALIDPQIHRFKELEEDRETTDNIDRVEREIASRGRMVVYRYMDIARRLGELPGKKSIVLFRSGFRVDDANARHLERLTADCVRRRISFYAVDSRGLDIIHVEEDDAWTKLKKEKEFGLNPRGGSLMKPTDTNKSARGSRHVRTQLGLRALAEQTGGKVFLNRNDLGSVFEAVVEDTGGYYLLGYYPPEPETESEYREIEVTVCRPRVKVTVTVPGYQASPSGAVLGSIYQALQADPAVTDLPLLFNIDFFRGAQGESVMVYGLGVNAADAGSQETRDGAAVSFTVLTRAVVRAGTGPPVYDERQVQRVYDPEALRTSRKDPHGYMHLGSSMALAPGEYDWRLAVRDEVTGRVGVLASPLPAPDFGRESTPSSLFLTTLATKADEGERGGVLDVQGTRFLPAATQSFRRGQRIFGLYDLYNPTVEDLAAPAVQISMLRDQEPVTGLRITGKAFAELELGRIRFVAAIETEGLAAGRYSILAMLPNRATRKVPFIVDAFTLRE